MHSYCHLYYVQHMFLIDYLIKLIAIAIATKHILHVSFFCNIMIANGTSYIPY